MEDACIDFQTGIKIQLKVFWMFARFRKGQESLWATGYSKNLEFDEKTIEFDDRIIEYIESAKCDRVGEHGFLNQMAVVMIKMLETENAI
jgi:hypothetical protein